MLEKIRASLYFVFLTLMLTYVSLSQLVKLKCARMMHLKYLSGFVALRVVIRLTIRIFITGLTLAAYPQ